MGGRVLHIEELVKRFCRHHAKINYKGAKCRPIQAAMMVYNVATPEIRKTTLRKFRPKVMMKWIDCMIAAGWNYKTVNESIHCVKRMCRFAVMNELMPVEVANAIQCVDTLKGSDSRVPKPRKITPAEWDDVQRVLPFLKPQFQDMVLLQWHSGMRPGELCNLLPAELDTSMEDRLGVWILKPTQHKNAWRDQKRQIVFGPKSIAILQRHIKWSEPDKPVFRKINKRTRPLSASDYTSALSKGFDRAERMGLELTRWSPNQLRHSAGTRANQIHGIEAAAAVLGNDISTAQIYAERNMQLAIEVAQAIG